MIPQRRHHKYFLPDILLSERFVLDQEVQVGLVLPASVRLTENVIQEVLTHLAVIIAISRSLTANKGSLTAIIIVLLCFWNCSIVVCNALQYF